MRIVFMGTPALAVASLEALRREHEIALVVTQPDKIGGRGHKLLPSPVKEYSLAHGLPIAQPEKARDAGFIAQLRGIRPEAIAVVAYGQILPREILELPRENLPHGGCINLHFSLLPRWRGAAPVQYAIWHGDQTTGVSTQWTAEKLDAGDVILQREIEIGQVETSGDLFEKLTPLGATVLLETMRLVENGTAPRAPQDETGVTFAPTIKKEDARIDWKQSASQIANQIRAFNPRPGTWCEFHGEPLKLWLARCEASTQAEVPGAIIEAGTRVLIATGDGVLELLEVQPAGKPKMKAGDWARGARLKSVEGLN